VVTFQFLTLYPASTFLSLKFIHSRVTFEEELPSVFETLKSVACFSLVSEAYFYYSHRLLHHPLLFQHCHAFHHTYTAPIALESLYFNPIESLIQSLVLVAGPLLLGCHVMLLHGYSSFALTLVILHHTGYHIPGDHSPGIGSMVEFHDKHHAVFHKNFGVTGWLDWLHGTLYNGKESLGKTK